MGRRSFKISQYFYTANIVLSVFLSCGWVRAAENLELVDRIVAVVNGTPILNSAVDEKITNGPLVIISPYPAPESSSDFDKALNDLVNLELILNFASEREIELSDNKVEEQIERILREKGASKDELMNFLKQTGKSYESYKEDVRKQLIVARFQGIVIQPLIKITDNDIISYYIRKHGSDEGLIAIDLKQLLIPVEESSPSHIIEAKEKSVNDAYKSLISGMDIEKVGKLYAEDNDNAVSELKSIKLKDLSENFRNALANLDEGQYSPPIRSPKGFHIFYVVKKSFDGGNQFELQKRKLEGELRMREVGNQTDKWLAQQHAKSKIEIIK